METRTYTVYKFEELPKESQQKAINRWRNLANSNGDFNWTGENICNSCKESLKTEGFEVGEIYWSGFYSQGDGARIEISSVDWQVWTKDKPEFHLLSLIANSAYLKGFTIPNSYANHYSHSKTQEFVVESDLGERFKTCHKLIESAQETIDQFIRDKSDELYRELQEAYEYENSDDAIIETIKANEYDFTIDGRID